MNPQPEITGLCSVCAEPLGPYTLTPDRKTHWHCQMNKQVAERAAAGESNPPGLADDNVEAVRIKLHRRSVLGLNKYGVTTERIDLTEKQWLIHAQEEAMDLAVYLQRLISKLP